MTVSRRGLFALVPALAAVPAAKAVGLPRDLIVSVPGTVIQNSQFSGGIQINNADGCTVTNCLFTQKEAWKGEHRGERARYEQGD